MPRFLMASDSLKGSISSARAAELLGEAALARFPDCEVRELAVADGGEGTVEAVVAATGGELRHAVVRGPLGDATDAAFALLPGGRAPSERAAAAGQPAGKAPRCAGSAVFGADPDTGLHDAVRLL